MIDLWNWRTRTTTLYTTIRAMPDPRAAWDLWCATRTSMFASHPQSPIEAPASFSAIAVYPYNPALRFITTLTPTTGPRLQLEAGTDGPIRATPFASTNGLETLGGELTLYWLEGYGGGVFLPFTDATTGSETYGGGRYLLDTIKGADLGQTPDGGAILDFNFAYAPSCAHNDRYVCPLAPVANRLTGSVQGGERNPLP